MLRDNYNSVSFQFEVLYSDHLKSLRYNLLLTVVAGASWPDTALFIYNLDTTSKSDS